MKAKITQEFSGKINGVEIDDENIFCRLRFLLLPIYNSDFVRELEDLVNNVYFDCDDFLDSIEKFGDIKFLFGKGEGQIESLNKKIAEGAFTKKKSIKR